MFPKPDQPKDISNAAIGLETQISEARLVSAQQRIEYLQAVVDLPSQDEREYLLILYVIELL